MKKNILLILTDQWRGDCLGCAGHPDIITPNLDALAQDGMLFDRAYASAPSCIPARACLTTGRTSYHAGFMGYADGTFWDYPQTMMTELRDAGYQTMNVGKTHFYPQRAHLGFEINTLYDPIKIDANYVSDYRSWLKRETNGRVVDTADLFDCNSCLYYPWMAEEYLHPTAWTVNTAIEHLENRDTTRPFFLQTSFHRPHPPFDPPREFFDLYRDKKLAPISYGDWCEEFGIQDSEINAWCGRRSEETLDLMRKAYYASITHIDYSIGKLIHWLKEKRLYNDTLIVFTSDHGELLGDHYMYRKISPFEGSAKIPLIVKGTEGFRRSCRSDVPVTHYDLMPTFLDYAGAEIPACVDGISMMPTLTEGSIPERTWIHGEHSGYGNNGWQFIWDRQYKYIWNTMSGKEYFFDIDNDPHELTNLAGKSAWADKIASYRSRLIAILEQRPQDGLTENGQLKPGTILPPVCASFRENSMRKKKECGML